MVTWAGVVGVAVGVAEHLPRPGVTTPFGRGSLPRKINSRPPPKNRGPEKVTTPTPGVTAPTPGVTGPAHSQATPPTSSRCGARVSASARSVTSASMANAVSCPHPQKQKNPEIAENPKSHPKIPPKTAIPEPE